MSAANTARDGRCQPSPLLIALRGSCIRKKHEAGSPKPESEAHGCHHDPFWLLVSGILYRGRGIFICFTLSAATSLFAQASAGGQVAGQQASKPVVPEVYESIAEHAVNDPTNTLGLSLALYEDYADNIFRSSIGGQSVSATSLVPGLFVNAGKGPMQFHADYAIAYGIYRDLSGLNNASHYGGLNYSYRTSAGASFGISDSVMSGPDDFGSFAGANPYQGQRWPVSWIEPDYSRQRVTSNSLTGSADFQLTGKSVLDVFAAYHLYRWAVQPAQGTDGIQAGAHFGYRLTRRISSSSYYSFYSQEIDAASPVVQVQRIDLAGFEYDLGRRWRATFSAGLGLVRYQGSFDRGADFQAGISRMTRSSLIAVQYERGFTTPIGLPGIYLSDMITADLGHRLTSRMNLRLNGQHSKNVSLRESGHYAIIRGSAVLEFALRSRLVASAHYSYWDQSWTDLLAPPLDTTRWAVYAGLQYTWCHSRP